MKRKRNENLLDIVSLGWDCSGSRFRSETEGIEYERIAVISRDKIKPTTNRGLYYINNKRYITISNRREVEYYRSDVLQIVSGIMMVDLSFSKYILQVDDRPDIVRQYGKPVLTIPMGHVGYRNYEVEYNPKEDKYLMIYLSAIREFNEEIASTIDNEFLQSSIMNDLIYKRDMREISIDTLDGRFIYFDNGGLLGSHIFKPYVCSIDTTIFETLENNQEDKNYKVMSMGDIMRTEYYICPYLRSVLFYSKFSTSVGAINGTWYDGYFNEAHYENL